MSTKIFKSLPQVLIIKLNLIENNFRIYCHLKFFLIESTVAYKGIFFIFLYY